MKLTGVELHPGGSATPVVLSFRDPRRIQPYNVKKITGLDASGIISRFHVGPGDLTQKYYQMSMEQRDIGVIMELNPNHINTTYSDLRDDLYRMISATRTGLVEIRFMNGETVVAVISGHISELDTDHFEKDQQVTLTISTLDGETLLKAPEPVNVSVVGISPLLTEIEDPISTAPHGFSFKMAFVAATGSFRLEDEEDPDVYFEITPDGGFLENDILAFSSEPADKYAYIIRGLDDIHVADRISRSLWPVIRPGINAFTVPEDYENMEWVSIEHRPTYWGV